MAGIFKAFSKSRRNSTASIKSSKSRRNSHGAPNGLQNFEVPVDINDRPIFTKKHTLVVAASTPDFDDVQLQQWRDEGYEVHYEYVHGKHRSSTFGVQRIGDGLEEGQKYAIVAYDHAASLLLHEAFEVLPKLCAFVAFYPDALPGSDITPRGNFQLQVHLAGTQPFAPAYPSYNYPATHPGFDERTSPAYDRVAAGLAWSRALSCVRKGFGIEPDLEGIRERHLAEEFLHKDAAATIRTMSLNPSVLHVPTLTGGVGQRELYRFYAEEFIPKNPPSIQTTLVSRTVGSDKVVDEMLISMTHTCEVPWLLPGVPPTNKHLEVALVSVVSIRGQKLEWERLYWDQASVLVQAGLLDPRLGAIGLGQGGAQGLPGLKQLPIVGAEGSLKVLEGAEGPIKYNELIKDW